MSSRYIEVYGVLTLGYYRTLFLIGLVVSISSTSCWDRQEGFTSYSSEFVKGHKTGQCTNFRKYEAAPLTLQFRQGLTITHLKTYGLSLFVFGAPLPFFIEADVQLVYIANSMAVSLLGYLHMFNQH
jgi:hypothetical protein